MDKPKEEMFSRVCYEITKNEKNSSQYPSDILPSHLQEKIENGGKKCQNCDQLEKEQEEWLGDKRSYIVELSNYADDNKSLERKLIEIERKLNDTNEELLQQKKVNGELKVLQEKWVEERRLLMQHSESQSQAIARFLDKQVKWKNYCHEKTMNKIFKENHKVIKIMNHFEMDNLDFVQEFREGLEVVKKCKTEKQQYENQIKIHQNNELNQTFITTQLQHRIEELQRQLDVSKQELKELKKLNSKKENIKPCKIRNLENKKQSKEKGQEDIKLSKEENKTLFPPTPETPSCNAKESFLAKIQHSSLQELHLNKSNKRTSKTSHINKKKVKLTESNNSHYQFGRDSKVKSLIGSEGWSPPQDLSRDFEPILRQLSTIPKMISPLRLDSEDSQTSTVEHNDFNDFHSENLKLKKTSLFSPIHNYSTQCQIKDVSEEFESSVDLSFKIDKVSSERSIGTQSGPELDNANSLSLDIISPVKSSTKENQVRILENHTGKRISDQSKDKKEIIQTPLSPQSIEYKITELDIPLQKEPLKFKRSPVIPNIASDHTGTLSEIEIQSSMDAPEPLEVKLKLTYEERLDKLKKEDCLVNPVKINIFGRHASDKIRPQQKSDELSSSSQNDTKPVKRESRSVSEIDCNSFKKKRRLKPDITYSMINCRSQCDMSKSHPTSNIDSKNVIDEPNVDINKPNTFEAFLSQNCNINTLTKTEKNPMTTGINNLNQLADKEDDNIDDTEEDSDCLILDIDEDYVETEEADINLSVIENTASYAPEYNTESIILDSKRRKLNLNSMNNPTTSSKTNKKLEFFDEKSQTTTKIVTVTPPFIVPQYQPICKYDNNLVKNNTDFSTPENCVPPFVQNATCSKMQNPKKPPVSETYLPKFYTDNDSENHTSETAEEKQESVKEKHLNMNLDNENMSKLQSLEELIPKGTKTIVKENVLRTVITKRNEEQEYYKKRNILEGRKIKIQVPADITEEVVEIVTPLVNEDLKSVTDIVEIVDKIKEYNIRVILKAVMVMIHNKTSDWSSWNIPKLPNKKSPIVHPRLQAIFLLLHMLIDRFTKDKNEEERRKFVEEELFFIEQTFYGKTEFSDNLPMFWYTLGLLYTLLARKFGFLIRVRQLMYDMLYCFTKRALTVALAMIKVWPLVLPVKPIEHYKNNPLALSVILHLTTAPPEHSTYKKTQHMVQQLHSLLKRKYRFQADTVKADDLFDLCLTHLGHPGVHEALVLLAKRQHRSWFVGRPLQQLIDVVEGWWKGGEKCSDVRAVAAINAISSSLRPMKESEVRDGLQKVYKIFTGIICDKNTPSWMREVVVRNACRVARLDLSLCLELISSWRPTEISQEIIDEILIEVIQRHTPDWWSKNSLGCYHLSLT